jgi:ribonuclease E
MRTAASAGLSALRIIEDEAARGRGERICLRAGKEAAVYVLNKKRGELADIEQRYGVSIEILIDEGFEGARMTVDSSGPRPVAAPPVERAVEEEPEDETLEISLEGEEEEAEASGDEREFADEGEGQGRRRRRRRRGGRRRGRREGGEAEVEAPREEQPSVAAEEQPAAEVEGPVEEAEGGKRRRRRRGGRGKDAQAEQPAELAIEPDSSPMVERPTDEEPPIAETEAAEEPQPKPKRRRSKKAAPEAEAAVAEPAPPEAPPAETADQEAPATKPSRKRRTKAAESQAQEPAPAPEEPVSVPAANNDTSAETGSEPRRGWWQRTFG